MNASRVRSLSPRLTRWAGLLALAVLPFAAGACIAQTGTSEGTGSGTPGEHSAASANGAIQDNSGPSLGKGVPQNNPPPNGPIFGPIPSPWDQSSGGDPSGASGTSQEPLPSPWMNQGGSSSSTPSSSTPQPGH